MARGEAGSRGSLRRIGFVVAVALLLGGLGRLGPPPAAAPDRDPRVVQATVTLTPVADATVDATASGENFGDAQTLEVFGVGQNEVGRALIRFDLAADVPPEAVIDSAELELYLSAVGQSEMIDLSAATLEGAWSEARVTWDTQPGAGEPVVVTPVAGRTGRKTLNITPIVQAWQSGANYGLVLAGPEWEPHYGFTFRSREARGDHPQLTVTYHLPAIYQITGHVYEGQPPGTGAPWGGVEVGLYGDEDDLPYNGSLTMLDQVTTGGDGAFVLTWEGDPFPFFHVIETDPPDAYSTAAQADAPGHVIQPNQVTYEDIPPATYGGVAFWDQPLPAGCPNLLTNGNFEQGSLLPWGSEGAVSLGEGRESAHGAWLAGADNVAGEVWQTVSIPAGADPVLLAFWWLADTEAAQPGDILHAGVRVGEQFDPLLSLSPAMGVVRWRQAVVDLVGYSGQEVAVVLRGETDGETPTTFGLDDVQLLACGGELPGLQILSGPTASEITQTSARISWETNRDSDSNVRYDTRAGVLADEESDPALVRSHAVLLTGLEPSTTYQFLARSATAGGEAVESRAMAFQTEAQPDDVDPSVSLRDPGLLRGTATIAADASDDEDVEKVEFYFDDDLLFTAFSPPFQFSFDTTGYENGPHAVVAKAYDIAGRSAEHGMAVDLANPVDETIPYAIINLPKDDDTVSGKVTISTSLGDDVGVCQVCFYIDGAPKECAKFPACPESPYYEFGWDTTKETNGKHSLAVMAVDGEGKEGVALIRVWVNNVAPPPPAQPNLIVEKLEVYKHGHTFAIELTVRNLGQGWASNLEIRNALHGFQALAGSGFYPAHATNEGRFTASSMAGQCVTKDTTVGIAPNSSQLFVCGVVPVLIHPNPPAIAIGKPVELLYDGPGGKKHQKTFNIPVVKTTAGDEPSMPLSTAHTQAVKETDYLIVTHPGRMFSLNPGQQGTVNEVLAEMAELAWDKDGVLGYLNVNDRNVLRNLLKPKGGWAAKMKDGFYKVQGKIGGYLLIVGETEIIPAWNLSVKPSKCDWCATTVSDSDHNYADTYSGWPSDIIVGRIIGNDAADLLVPLQTSTSGQGFDRSDALVVSGTGDGQDKFVSNVNDIEKILKGDNFTVDKLHWKDQATNAQRLQQFRNRATNKDVIYFRDHGGVDCWCPALGTADFPVNFGNTNPFAFACACQAGNYERGDDDNIAEAFFDSGASVYIGSTEDSPRSINNQGAKNFFNNWDAGKTVGWAYTLTERVLTTSSDTESWWRYWVAEYNLYGDPKAGVSSSQSAAVEPLPEPLEAASSLDVEIPQYQVSTADGVDHVEIPGGQLLLLQDQPEIPYYVVSVDYPPGSRIQEVSLTERSGLLTDSGLNLPVASMALDDSTPGAQQPARSDTGWLPQDVYAWEVVENPDNTVALVISLYPFYYDPQTTEVQFYRNYRFEIDHTLSDVTITDLAVDQASYQVGEVVPVALGLANSGEATDATVEVLVRRYGLDEIVDGLLLRTLTGLSGAASYATLWDSAGAEPGYYYVEATLSEPGGDLLDRKTALFRLGISSGSITSFSASPGIFGPGEPVTIALVFANDGTLSASGSSVTEVHDQEGHKLQTFVHDFADLEPGGTVHADDVWDTTGVAEGAYSVVGYVSYDGQTTEPRTAVVSTRAHIYLPALTR